MLREASAEHRNVSALAFAATIALLTAPVFAQTEAAAPPAASLAPEELDARRKSDTAPVIIDVRTRGEYMAGHIPGALNVAVDQLARRIPEIDAPYGIALYCMVGPRARAAEAALIGAGYNSVLHLNGGFAAWKAAGLPVARER
jgi:rhodanese-related sulfurtransferase